MKTQARNRLVMKTPYLRIVGEIDDIDAAVREAGVDPGELDAPWHNDFPL
jgi:hypothetical protein